jgi:hypothetical protein
MNVPSVLEWGGIEREILWYLSEIKKKLLKRGTLPLEYVGVPLPKIKVMWRQSKQRKERRKAEQDLSLNLLGQPYQQNGCPVCRVEVSKSSWKCLGPPWEAFHRMGFSLRAIGWKCLMIVMYNGRETGRDCTMMQCLRWVNVLYLDFLAHTVIPYIDIVHKRVEIEMANESPPQHKFIDLCWEFMWLTLTTADGTKIPLFDVVMPIVSGIQSGSAVATYQTDNKKAAILVKKIKYSVASWYFRYWTQVQKYKLGMIQKLMQSFNIDASKLAGFSTFNVNTQTVMTKYGDIVRQLDDLDAGFRIDQWAADLEELGGTRMLISGHREALAQTLCNRVDNVDNANRSGPSHRTIITGSTGNSTKNSKATTQQHMLRDKAVRNIDLVVDKNYVLESSLLETQGHMAAILAQNQMLQDWQAVQESKCFMTISGHRKLLAQAAQDSDQLEPPPGEETAEEEKETDKGPFLIQGGSNCQVGCDKMGSVPMLTEGIAREVQQHPAEAFLINFGNKQGEVNMEDDKLMPICGDGDGLELQAQATEWQSRQ